MRVITTNRVCIVLIIAAAIVAGHPVALAAGALAPGRSADSPSSPSVHRVHAAPAAAGDPAADDPDHFALYYSGPPCEDYEPDRTFAEFQVNLAPRVETRTGRLLSGPDGEAILLAADGSRFRLVSNASRADWLLGYPFSDRAVDVHGRPVLGSDCTVEGDTFYVDALYPAIVMRDEIDTDLDLHRRIEETVLRHAVDAYSAALADGRAGRDGSAASGLEDAMFTDEASESVVPWKAVLVDPDERKPDGVPVDVVLSGSDGGAGLFGHIAIGIDGEVYNVYPKGSERGAPTAVPLGDYLFSPERGQVLRRPVWVLRVEGLPEETVGDIRAAIEEQIEHIDTGERPYHPTRNNCVTACLRSLEPIGIKVKRVRYFTRRFPRPVFSKVLNELPRIIDRVGRGSVRVELWYLPQVADRPLIGRAPNRPLWDRTSPD